jgi:hypothetical protein
MSRFKSANNWYACFALSAIFRTSSDRSVFFGVRSNTTLLVSCYDSGMKMLTLPKGSPDPLPELAAFLAARRGDRLPRQLPAALVCAKRRRRVSFTCSAGVSSACSLVGQLPSLRDKPARRPALQAGSGLALVQNFQYACKLLDACHPFWLKGDDQVRDAGLGKGAQFLGDVLGRSGNPFSVRFRLLPRRE